MICVRAFVNIAFAVVSVQIKQLFVYIEIRIFEYVEHNGHFTCTGFYKIPDGCVCNLGSLLIGKMKFARRYAAKGNAFQIAV